MWEKTYATRGKAAKRRLAPRSQAYEQDEMSSLVLSVLKNNKKNNKLAASQYPRKINYNYCMYETKRTISHELLLNLVFIFCCMSYAHSSISQTDKAAVLTHQLNWQSGVLTLSRNLNSRRNYARAVVQWALNGRNTLKIMSTLFELPASSSSWESQKQLINKRRKLHLQ